MNEFQNKKLTRNAKVLRKNMTKEEKHLWYDCLKHLPVTVHRQKVVGKYIVDFYIAASKLVIELDGSQHYEEKNRQQDALRDAALEAMGILVLRYSNRDIHCRFREVCDNIYNTVVERASLPLEGKGDREAVDEV